MEQLALAPPRVQGNPKVEDGGKKENPPYDCVPAWMQKFIEVARVVQVTEVNTSFVKSNKITNSKYEYGLLKALRFLQIIDKEGATTGKLSWLRMVGEPYKQNVAKIVGDAYSDLLGTVAVKIVGPDALQNHFVTKYGYMVKQAEAATGFFVWIATEGGIELSPEISNILAKQRKIGSRRSAVASSSKVSQMIEEDDLVTTVDVPGMPAVPLPSTTSNVQATISMNLDKDTPVEIWRMVLKLLGLPDEPEDPNLPP